MPGDNNWLPALLEGVGFSDRFFFFFNRLRFSWSKWQNLQSWLFVHRPFG